MVNVKKLGYMANRHTGIRREAAGTQDMMEAFMAFQEKRPHEFTGR